MISLNRLKASNFKRIEDIEIDFPPNGTFIIRGENGAGKSTLFEAIFFALYGRLLPDHGRLEDAIRYGSETGHVQLEFSVRETSLLVTRELNRRRQQRTTLEVNYFHSTPDLVRGADRVNERILQEIGNLTSDALLNSCFVEQKRLGRLEEQSKSAREEALFKLLNLDMLTRLTNEYRVREQDRRELEKAKGKLDLAIVRDQLPCEIENLSKIERYIEAIEVLKDLKKLLTLKQELKAMQQKLVRLQSEAAEIEGKIVEIEKLKQGIEALSRIIEIVDQLTQEKKKLSRIREKLQEIENLEAILPQKELELAEVQRLLEDVKQIDSLKSQSEKLQTAITDVQLKATTIENLRKEIAQCEEDISKAKTSLAATQLKLNSLQALSDAAQTARGMKAKRDKLEATLNRLKHLNKESEEYQSQLNKTNGFLVESQDEYYRVNEKLKQVRQKNKLEEWIKVKRNVDESANFEASISEIEERRQQKGDSQALLASRSAENQKYIVLNSILTLAALMVAIVAGLIYKNSVLLPLGGIVFTLTFIFEIRLVLKLKSMGTELENIEDEIRQIDLEKERIKGRKQAFIESQGFINSSLESCEKELSQLEMDIPSSLKDAIWKVEESKKLLNDADENSLLDEVQAINGKIQSLLTATEHLKQEKETRDKELTRFDIKAISTEYERLQGMIEGLDKKIEDQLKLQASDETERDELLAKLLLSKIQDAQGNVKSLITSIQIYENRKSVCEKDLKIINPEKVQYDLQSYQSKHKNMIEQIGDREASLAPILRQRQLESDISKISNRIGSLQREIDELRSQRQQKAELESDLSQTQSRIEQLQNLLFNQIDLYNDAISEPLPENNTSKRQKIKKLRGNLTRLDEDVIKKKQKTIEREIAEINARISDCQRNIDDTKKEITSKAEKMRMEVSDEPSIEIYQNADPIFAEVSIDMQSKLQNTRDECIGQIQHLKQEIERLESQYYLHDVALDRSECEIEVKRKQKDIKVKEKIDEISQEARKRILEQVLPITIRNMEKVLPELTAGRYRDACLTTDYKIQIWDQNAMKYVMKSLFSGGEQDQFSLALRLAFAVATLPQELGTSPGFIFLDEPLSSFDSIRKEGFIHILTNGFIREHFRQIFLISHEASIDVSKFDYQIEMVEGQITKSFA